MNRIIEQAGATIDIKFGVAINEQLADTILVSVIASDFTEEYDFTATPQFQMPKKDQVGNSVDEAREKAVAAEEGKGGESGQDEESVESQILPNFLKGKIDPDKDDQ
ncbi:MAG: hypothetical protein BWY98_01344 [Tenericutes bacterium ADurb.BinA155]|nr:MAG: hypothetical protein BWY98_01344 [Tenericutes bacterium ADurb.BinA155]